MSFRSARTVALFRRSLVITAAFSFLGALAPRPLLAVDDRAATSVWSFTNVAAASGIAHTHGFVGGPINQNRSYAGGAAVGDYDRDGDIDIFAVRGTIGPDLLYRNNGNGTFTDVAAAAGVNPTHFGCGPVFADYDGDGWLDLFVGSIEGDDPMLYRNLGNGTFQNVSATCGITYDRSTFSSAFGDYDRDGDLDLFMTHRGAPQFDGKHLWRNNGNGTFTDVDAAAGFADFGPYLFEYTFTPNWADLNDDDWPDLLLASDLGTSEVYMNDGDGTFTRTLDGDFLDEDGMGSAIGDYDEDGDLDWFVSGILDAGAGSELLNTCGNGAYQNDGSGAFACVTDATGLRNGYWGWGASFQDLNNDGHLDLYHVNGFGAPFDFDPARLFVSNGDGTFTQRAEEVGLDFLGQGRGISIFDYDRDGDLDIFIAQNSQTSILARNNGGNALNWISLELHGYAPNTEAIGARVYVTVSGTTQMREIRAGSNYASQDPAIAHFGLGTSPTAGEIRIEWPDGEVDVLNGVPANIALELDQGATPVGEGAGGGIAGTGSPIQLAGAAPNPLTRDTAIRFELARSAEVTVRIYDTSGRALRTLVSGVLQGGAHSVAWDGRDATRTPVAAGVYAYRVEAGGRSAQGKIAVVR